MSSSTEQQNDVTPAEFQESVKQLIKMRTQLKTMQIESRAIRESMEDHRNIIMDYMENSGIHNISYKSHELKLRSSKRKKKPSMKQILDDGSDFFSSNEEKTRFQNKIKDKTLISENVTLSIKDPKKDKK